jgi:hypothetical protein
VDYGGFRGLTQCAPGAFETDMAKFISTIAGAALIAAGAALAFFSAGGLTPLAVFLISSGAGMLLSGIGTLLSKGPLTGVGSSQRNPIAPWNAVYGRAKVGGTIIYIGEFDELNKYLDLVIVLACHPCKSVDALLFDGQRIRLDGNGCSFHTDQQTVSIDSITRDNGVVTVVLSGAVTDLQDGDTLIVKNVTSDPSLNGKFPVIVLSSTSLRYICGGSSGSGSGGNDMAGLPRQGTYGGRAR